MSLKLPYGLFLFYNMLLGLEAQVRSPDGAHAVVSNKSGNLLFAPQKLRPYYAPSRVLSVTSLRNLAASFSFSSRRRALPYRFFSPLLPRHWYKKSDTAAANLFSAD